ncbi:MULTISPECIES: hypothetical protein [Mesorhizobium]|uniref:Uncharacterized protein n=1 Tax=Mesorhizobium huakuii TaxID=28104 RepID=A0ABZ0VI86_9HYPH|nr:MULTISPECIES: hypothetical protein [Mesorhizobium]MBZ9910460.1 hypothetical protein [Mesorhizobium sp. BR115XR7A]WQB96960.1 hypothetical protein U0R22_001058 [Mesorhizobium huakuii]
MIEAVDNAFDQLARIRPYHGELAQASVVEINWTSRPKALPRELHVSVNWAGLCRGRRHDKIGGQGGMQHRRV